MKRTMSLFGVLAGLPGLALLACNTPVGTVGPAGPEGSQGPTGPAGVDGTSKTYGDGSAGSLVVTTGNSALLGYSAAVGYNYNFTNITVQQGALLVMASGTVVRCTGDFINDGIVGVQGSASSKGQSKGNGSTSIGGAIAGVGEKGNATAIRAGGIGAAGLDLFTAGNILNPGIVGGGGGAGGNTIVGGLGGGTGVIIVQGVITNSATGVIAANGQGNSIGGSGAGAGGILILASRTSITNSGSIQAEGGKGGNSSNDCGAGGGGGGGIVHFLSPNNTLGSVDVSGGPAGTLGAAMSVTQDPHFGGGAGGACGGDGGYGGNVDTNRTPSAGSPGIVGWVINTTVDPTPLF